METKVKSQVALKVDELLNQAAVLEMIEPVIPPDAWLYTGSGELDFNPSTEESARKLVGSLIRLFKAKPVIAKPYTKSLVLSATFTYNGVKVKVSNYKGKKCAVTKRTIVHEAVPEQVIPAKEAWVEEVEELVCEMPEVNAEVTPTPEPGTEVPF